MAYNQEKDVLSAMNAHSFDRFFAKKMAISVTQDITERARGPREKLTSGLQEAARFLRFLLVHGALSTVFALAIGFIEMQVYMATHSPAEFAGMYLVVAFISAQIACGLALPAYLWVYFREQGTSQHRYAAAASFVANIAVWLFFHLLGDGLGQ